MTRLAADQRIGTLAILGLGLMGGSLAWAAKQRKAAWRVVGYARRAETRHAALAAGAVDEACDDPARAVKGADLVVICVPILNTIGLLELALPGLHDGSVVTDVGSTKAEVVRHARRALKGSGARFVGSHPIAGSDATGFEAARGDLYEGSVVVMTPTAGDRPRDVARVRHLWLGVGARVVTMAAPAHDRMLARTSHLPHLAASALTRAVLDVRPGQVRDFCGTGFRDTTRIAAGSEDIWHDIAATNRAALVEELDRYRRQLDRLREALAEGRSEEVRRYLRKARELRRACDTCAGSEFRMQNSMSS